MPLKHKIAVFILIVVFAFLALRYFNMSRRSPEAAVKIRIETKFSDAGDSLLLTQAKGITQQTTLQELLRRLGRQSPSAEKNQREILDIQKRVRVEREGNTEIFKILVRHPSSKEAREIASQLAQSFQAVEALEERANAQAAEADLERQTAAARDEINTLEQTFRKIQIQNSPSDIDTALVNRLREKQAHYQALSETYTALHPDLIELDKEIESLKLQIMDGPPIDLIAVKEAENNLREADARYRELRQKWDDARLQKEQIAGRVTILEISSSTSAPPQKISPITLAVIGVILLLALVLRIVSR